ncbi:CdaR family protein [Miniphocaeibacter massiliensis]|uniref:CdaR family protein n=1 Tax=Miniphocaeibacter massiliensis TaxID=2041841 RepID=UPI0013ED680E|nr:CdaR family protein [Miniphocaeibacter massiliensis]
MERIKNNWPIKLISLIFAFGLWYYVLMDANPEGTREFRNVEVNIKGKEVLAELDKDIIAPIEPTVYIKVRGKRDVISKLKESEIEAEIDLNTIKEDLKSGIDEKRIYITYKLPTGVFREDETEKFLDFRFDNIVSAEYDIKEEQIGNLPSTNLAIKNIEVVPDSVTIKGQEKAMNKIDKVCVLVDVSKETEDVTRNIPIEVFDKNGDKIEDLEISEKNAKVNIYITNSKQVPIKLKMINELPEGISIESSTPSKEKITIIGDKKILDKISEIETSPIDLSKIKNNMVVDARLMLPDGVGLMQEENITIDIVVKSEEESSDGLANKTFVIKKEKIEILKNTKDYEVIFPADIKDITVTLEGKEETINKVKEEEVKLSIDIGGLWRGKHKVDIETNSLKDITKTINPASIEIELK